ncbi:MAG: nitronate monooxygenase, partial [Pseudomonadales bacterium]
MRGMRTRLTDRLGLDLPLIQAPMAGVSTPALAAAASRAGALGSIAVGAATDAAAERAIAEAMACCPGPLNVNVFTHPAPRRDADRERAWLERLAPAFAEFGVKPPEALAATYPTFDDRPALLDALLTHRPAVVSFHFGLPDARAVRALKAAGVMLLLTVTSLAEARRAEAAGMDAVVAQGWEAGGHRGAFEPEHDRPLDTRALLAALRCRVAVPVIAACGI